MVKNLEEKLKSLGKIPPNENVDIDGYINRSFQIENKVIMVAYSLVTGKIEFCSQYVGFCVDPVAHKTYKYTDAAKINLFTVLKLMKDAFKGVDIPQICFRAKGNTKREARIKDMLYCRFLRNEGYKSLSNIQYHFLSFKKSILSFEWYGPRRRFIRET